MATLGGAPGRFPTVGSEISRPAPPRSPRTSVPSVKAAPQGHRSAPSVAGTGARRGSSSSGSDQRTDNESVPLLLGLGLVGLAFFVDMFQGIPALLFGSGIFSFASLLFISKWLRLGGRVLKVFRWINSIRALLACGTPWSCVGAVAAKGAAWLAQKGLEYIILAEIKIVLFMVAGMGFLLAESISILALVIFWLIFYFSGVRFWTRWQIAYVLLELVPVLNTGFFWTIMMVSVAFGWRNLLRKTIGGGSRRVVPAPRLPRPRASLGRVAS